MSWIVVYVCMYMHEYTKWGLFVRDTLGPANLLTVGSLIVHFSEVKCISTIRTYVGESIFCV